MFKQINLILAMALCLCLFYPRTLRAQRGTDEYIYFDLRAGNVTFTEGTYSGYVFVNGETGAKPVSGTHVDGNKYYVFQSSTTHFGGYPTLSDYNASPRQNCQVPSYETVMVGEQTWSEFITNNSDVDAVQVGWDDNYATTGREATNHKISFWDDHTYDVVVDNIFSTYEVNSWVNDSGEPQKVTVRAYGAIEGGAKPIENYVGHPSGVGFTYYTDCKVTIKLKGDNRVANVFFTAHNNDVLVDNNELHITSAAGNGENSGSLTAVSYVEHFDLNNSSSIGGTGSYSGHKTGPDSSDRLYFDGGTVYAGAPKANGTNIWASSGKVTHVIGARQTSGIFITGGRLTAVSNSTAAAIGGGGGYVANGGVSDVNISGGEVYAYNNSIYAKEYNTFVPCVAIGGSSCVRVKASPTEVNITGGTVYAQSMGGCAIGGGGSAQDDGGDAVINISGDAKVTAKSLPGKFVVGGVDKPFDAGIAIGGGVAGWDNTYNPTTSWHPLGESSFDRFPNGGSATFDIDMNANGWLRAGSIGGGYTYSTGGGKLGYVKAYVKNGDCQAQFVMQAGASDNCEFHMTGGTLHGSDYQSTTFPLYKANGAAVWMDDPNGVATISAGKIYDNHGDNGGAIYLNGGNFTMSGGEIYENKAATDGGSVYMAGGDFTMTGGKMNTNEAVGDGGSVYMAGGDFAMTGGEMNYNEAANGGAVFINGGQIEIKGQSALTHNSAGHAGGAIYAKTLDAATTVEIGLNDTGLSTSPNLSYNKAVDKGGALAIYKAGAGDLQFHVHNGTLDYNECVKGDGGAAYILDAEEVQLFNAEISHNMAYGNGGGIVVDGGNLVINKLDGSNPVHTTAEYNQSGHSTFGENANGAGGAFCVKNGQLSVAGESMIRYNTAAYAGGGIYANTKNHDLTVSIGLDDDIDHCPHICYNKAKLYGGALGICRDETSTSGILHFYIYNGVMEYNEALGTSDYSDFGQAGAVGIIGAQDVVLYNAKVNHNTAYSDGGAFAIKNGHLTIAKDYLSTPVSSEITYNRCGQRKTGTDTYVNNIYGKGGAFFVNGGSVTLNDGTVTYNRAEAWNDDTTIDIGCGGAFYVTDADVTFPEGSESIIQNNYAKDEGGGIYVWANNINDTIRLYGQADISNNIAENYGGGCCFYGEASNSAWAIVTIGRTGTSDNATFNNNKSLHAAGGAICMVENVDFKLNKGTFTNNEADGDGGAIYLSDYFWSGAHTNGQVKFDMAGGVINNNKANNGNGGGIYLTSSSALVPCTATLQNVNMQGNFAQHNGGGVYADGAGLTCEFKSGTFQANHAVQRGGGFYVGDESMLKLRGTAQLIENFVDKDGQGGGIFLAGRLQVGELATGDPAASILSKSNYEKVSETDHPLNNIYLQDPDLHADHRSVIEVMSDLTDAAGETSIGISVPHGWCPVIFADPTKTSEETAAAWLDKLFNEMDNSGTGGGSSKAAGDKHVFDDKGKYLVLRVTDPDSEFEIHHIYFWGCWNTEITTNPQDDPTLEGDHFTVDGDGTVHIWSKEGLAWLSSYVNGLNTCAKHPGVNVKLEADVDMSEYLWVPLGGTSEMKDVADPKGGVPYIFEPGGVYYGNFDGQGHTITGIDSRYLNNITEWGLVGNLAGGEIKDVNLINFKYLTSHATQDYNIGGIVGKMDQSAGGSGSSTIKNCQANGIIEINGELYDKTYPDQRLQINLGGLVGSVADGFDANVYSSFAVANIISNDATTIGGLVGKTASSTNVKNSFANVNLNASAADCKVGGLVGNNAGTVENCYARNIDDSKTFSNYLVGNNESTGHVNYCYAPAAQYIGAGTTANVNGCGTFTKTWYTAGTEPNQYVCAPISYTDNKDNQVTVESTHPYKPTEDNAQLYMALNNWVDDHSGFSSWFRTTSKDINGDYPVLKFDDFMVIYQVEGREAPAYDFTVEDLLAKYDGLDNVSSALYVSSEVTEGNTEHYNVKIFLPEGVNVKATKDLKVYANQTLEYNLTSTSGEYWHNYASAMSDSPLGFKYGELNQVPFSWNPNPCNVSLASVPEESFFPTDAGVSNIDFFSFYEPQYHWINLKRNSNSHWHMNAPGLPITYTNETVLTPGKGYLVAIDKEVLIQECGTLNHGDVNSVVTNTDNTPYGGLDLQGFNLLGNPYRAYLDFDEFVTANTALWEGTNNLNNSYFVFDSKENAYLSYPEGKTPSVGSDQPTKWIAPHQAFFIVKTAANAESNKEAKFQESMCSLTGTGSLRGEAPAFPLVNLWLRDEAGHGDLFTVEFDRPELDGAGKQKSLRSGDAIIFARYAGQDYAMLFLDEEVESLPLHFDCTQGGTYTLTWNTANAEFGQLTLVDNLTGVSTDCLSHDSYVFEANPSDFTSRFKLIFSYSSEEDDNDDNVNANFAFFSNGELIVNGEGNMQIMDVNGRVISAERLTDTQNCVSMPNVAAGVYVIRLNEKSQKIVVR